MKFSDDRRANAADRFSYAADRMQNKAERFFRPKTVGLLFALVIAVLVAISILVVVHEKNSHRVDDNDAPVSSPGGEQQTAGDKDFLLAFIDDSDDTIRMLAALHANESEGRFSVRYVSPSAVVSINNMDGTLQSHYQSNGAPGLCAAAAAYLQCTIDRYLLFDDNDFIAMAKLMSDFSLEIDMRADFTYKEIPITIEPGTQITTPDMLCKYFAYLCDNLYSGGEAAVTEMLSLLATKLFSDTSEPMDAHLQRFADCASSTNVVAMDIGTYAASLPVYVEGRDRVEIICDGVIY
ncbi:MAG: hypothetical protein IJL52_07795 [Clostridia bacterium]|nr:hypothetical protein [Clostridia bacterium]